jgi:hypothetical protein
MYRSKLQKDFEFNNRIFKIIFGVAVTVIVIFWIAMISFLIFAGSTAVKASDQIGQRGLKAVIEEIWCGPNNKCL